MISKEDIGRRVLVYEIEYKDNPFYNLKGTVKDYFKGGSSLAVEFDDKFAMCHDCGGGGAKKGMDFMLEKIG